MKADPQDQNFMTGMKQLLGMEPEDVEKLLDTLDTDTLLALTDAIGENDKEEAERIISQDEEINDLFFHNDDKKKKKHPVRPPDDHQFMHGDDVAIITDEDGKKKFVSATVYKPNAPGNTVGVKIEGKPKMVEKDKIYTLEENVMGMIGIPNLARMQQLAGIGPSQEEFLQAPSPVDVTTVEEPEEQSSFDAGPDEGCPVKQAMSALDVVANALPDIRLGDLKMIRQKINDIQAKMNESFAVSSNMPEGRPKKKI